MVNTTTGSGWKLDVIVDVDVTSLKDWVVSVLLVEDWTGVEVEVKVRGIYGCGPMKFAGSKSGGNGF